MTEEQYYETLPVIDEQYTLEKLTKDASNSYELFVQSYEHSVGDEARQTSLRNGLQDLFREHMKLLKYIELHVLTMEDEDEEITPAMTAEEAAEQDDQIIEQYERREKARLENRVEPYRLTDFVEEIRPFEYEQAKKRKQEREGVVSNGLT